MLFISTLLRIPEQPLLLKRFGGGSWGAGGGVEHGAGLLTPAAAAATAQGF